MNVVDWFDPKKREHLEAWLHLYARGCWPAGFVPKGITNNPFWWKDSVADKVTTHLVDQELRGHWQKEAPTQDGLHWLSDRHGTLLTPVYFAGGKAIVAKDDAPGGPAWDGWYWSEPIRQPPKLARQQQGEGA